MNAPNIDDVSSVPFVPTLHDTVKQYDRVALLLQGGGALGSYQAGIYEGLYNQGIKIDSISGISIGALNTAVIAGNRPEHRVAKLKSFWETITQRNYSHMVFNPYQQTRNMIHQLGQFEPLAHYMPWVFENGMLEQQLRTLESSFEATLTLFEGQRGFFKPRYQVPFNAPPNHLSYYTVDRLKDTLAAHCDLDLINRPDEMLVSVSAVNVRTGNFTIFSNETQHLGFEHFIASGSLPPGFPAIEIDGEFYWDGGIVSNTPLDEIINHDQHLKQLIFQVDLWDARGLLPESMNEVDERIKDIRYSSKTRMVTDFMKLKLEYTRMIKDMMKMMEGTDCAKTRKHKKILEQAEAMTDVGVKNVIHLIYNKKSYERGYKHFEFSPATMMEHWQTGLQDIQNTFYYTEWFDLPEDDDIFVTHDVHHKRRGMAKIMQ